MNVVADTGPINYLVQLQHIDVLSVLYQRVLVPSAVQNELLNARAPAQVRLWMASPPPWLAVVPVELLQDTLLDVLDEGEAEAIQLAERTHADRVLMDEAVGRDLARARGLRVIGTLGVLRQASQLGIVDLRVEIRRVRELGFRVSQQVVDAVLQNSEA